MDWICAGHTTGSHAKQPGLDPLWVGDKLLWFTHRDPGETGMVRVEQLVGLSRNYGNEYGQH